MGWSCSSHRLLCKNKRMQKTWQIPEPCLKTEKVVEDGGDTNNSWSPWNLSKDPGKEFGWTGG